MLPMVMPPPEHEPVLSPYYLRPDVEPARDQAVRDGAGVEGAMPDIGHIAGEQLPGLAPVGPVVVLHLADSRGVAEPGPVAPRGVILHAVWRIGHHQVGTHAGEHALDGRRVGAVAAHQPVASQQPDVAQPADWHLGRGRHVVGIGEARRQVGQQARDFVGVEAGEREVEAVGLQLSELDAQQVVVPPSGEGQSVVSQHVGAALGRGEVGQLQRGHLGHAQLARGEEAAVAGDDAAVGVDQHRIGEAELGDAGGDLCHLRGGVGARVAGVRDQRCDGR